VKNRLVIGDWNVISDLSERKLKRSECVLVREPGNLLDGLMVAKDEYAPLHPQTFIKLKPEQISIPNARPRPPIVFQGDTD